MTAAAVTVVTAVIVVEVIAATSAAVTAVIVVEVIAATSAAMTAVVVGAGVVAAVAVAMGVVVVEVVATATAAMTVVVEHVATAVVGDPPPARVLATRGGGAAGRRPVAVHVDRAAHDLGADLGLP
jgi:hypothetical protein